MMPVESIFGHQIKNSNIRGTATGLKTTHGDTVIAPPDREHEIIIIIISIIALIYFYIIKKKNDDEK